MRLLQLQHDGSFKFSDHSSPAKPPKYAILSHTWGEDDQEVTFDDIKANVGKEKMGYKKLQFCRKQALRDRLEYFWVDTCCIDKSSSTELSTAINSMFRWYENAERCYVYLSDVSSRDQEWLPQLRKSRWFTRGWTLQELLAPKNVEFFSTEGDRLGDKHSLVQEIHDVTGISVLALEGAPLFQFSTEQKMSWASERVTKKEEDEAYCLMGLFNVHIPPIYGEGQEHAMKRLRTEIQSSIYPPSFQRARGPKQRKALKSKGTLSNLDTRLRFQTHRDPSCRHLIRFQEALVLLYTLGGPVIEQGDTVLHVKRETSSSPPTALRRRFLTDVAYICDYEGEGRTAIAIGLEATHQESIFWVASSSSPEKMIVSFMKSLLAKISKTWGQKELSSSTTARDIFTMCIEFASPHIETCRSALLASIEGCLEGLDRTVLNEAPVLVKWLRSWACQDSPIALCYFAYRNVGSECMRMITRLSRAPLPDTKVRTQHSLELCIHYIQRLRRYYLAAVAILPCGRILPELRNAYRVEGITTPSGVSLPPFDVSTTLESIAVRMHPAESPDLTRIQQALRDMDASSQLFQHFRKNYTSPQLKPHVHPEVQMLEWFHVGNRLFAADDRFIACSRPSCLCCQLYFRYHDGDFLEPVSDRKICLSWRPHELNTERGHPMSEKQQRILMNAMIKDIRKDALRRIDEASIPKNKYPKIVTTIRKSDDLRQARKSSTHARSCPVSVETSLALTSGSLESGSVSLGSGLCSICTSLPPANDVGVGNSATRCDPRKKLYGQVPLDFDFSLDDTDEKGGILL